MFSGRRPCSCKIALRAEGPAEPTAPFGDADGDGAVFIAQQQPVVARRESADAEMRRGLRVRRGDARAVVGGEIIAAHFEQRVAARAERPGQRHLDGVVGRGIDLLRPGAAVGGGRPLQRLRANAADARQRAEHDAALFIRAQRHVDRRGIAGEMEREHDLPVRHRLAVAAEKFEDVIVAELRDVAGVHDVGLIDPIDLPGACSR